MKFHANKALAVAVLTGGLLFAGSNVSSAALKDVTKDYWAKEEIEFLVENKIIKGYPDGLFRPSKSITKAHSAVIFVKALNLPITNNPDPGFKDVSKTHSLYKEISAAVAAGIFEKGETFNPNEEMSRESAAIAIANAFKLQSANEVSFTDVSKSAKSYRAIASLVEHDIATGYANGSFKPADKVTRAQFSIFIARALNPDFLPTKYTVPLNVNPAATFFHMALKNPSEAQKLFANKHFNMSNITKDVRAFELIRVKETGRTNGQVEFAVTFNADLQRNAGNTLLQNGKNKLYVSIKRDSYMNFKIISISKESKLKPSITQQEALTLFKTAYNSYWYIVMGGEGERNEERFEYNGMTYRYMAQSLNSKEKLQQYLSTIYTADKVDAQLSKVIKDLKIIDIKGLLAQPDADGGSALEWDHALIKATAGNPLGKHFEIDVPIGESLEYEQLIGELRYDQQADTWFVHELDQRMSTFENH